MDYNVQAKPYIPQKASQKPVRNDVAVKGAQITAPQVSFTGKGDKLAKQAWLKLKNLSSSMNEVTEFTNAFIAAIGTGIIAPAIILCSPGKGDKEDKEKKHFQALRQPLSAGLALGFQVPATFLVNGAINNLAYKNNSTLAHKFFDDEVLGALIPDKKYIAKHVTKDEIAALETEFNAPYSALERKLENKIRTNYEEVGLELTEEKLVKEVNKGKKKFLKDTAVERKHNSFLESKLRELSAKNIDIKDKDLVTGEIKDLITYRHKEQLAQIEKEANLSVFDKAADLMGFETKKLKNLKARKDAFSTEKGLELLREESPELFTNQTEKLKRYINVRNAKAQKIFGNKKFWLSLGVNLFMVSASCYALNWAHPKMKALIDKFKAKKQEKQNDNAQPASTTASTTATPATQVTPQVSAATSTPAVQSNPVQTSSPMIEKKIEETKANPQNQKVEVK